MMVKNRKWNLKPGVEPCHLVRPARYGLGGLGSQSRCLRRDRLIFGFSKWGPASAGGHVRGCRLRLLPSNKPGQGLAWNGR